MVRTWTVAASVGGFALCYEAPSVTGAGSGVDPADSGGAGDAPAEDPGEIPEGAHASAPGADDDDLDDDDLDLDEDQPITPERFKKVTAKLKKLSRRDRRFAPIRQRLKDLADRDGVSLDDLVLTQREYARLQSQIAANPKMRALFSSDGDDEPAETRRPKAKVEPTDVFDEKTLPFDPNETDANRYFANLAKDNHELKQTVQRLVARVEAMDGRDVARTEASEKSQWKSAIDAAAAQLDDEFTRTLFKDAMVGAYQSRREHHRSPQEIIAHYLKGKVSKKQADSATAAATAATRRPGAPGAAAQRIAEHNRTLPRTVAPPGTPAPARTSKERVADVNRRIRQGAY